RQGNRRSEPLGDRKVGDDWGDLRTTEHLNSWDEDAGSDPRDRNDPSQKRGLFDFILPAKPPRHSADRLADDIAAGWEENASTSAARADYASGYDDGYDRSSDRYDELDQGWEDFDREGAPPTDRAGERRTYGESLYGYDDEGPYPDELVYETGQVGEIGPDGVYEADYRVIEPPSKPLDEPLEDEREEYRD
ncbi:MAG: hypothetical protein WBD47_10235, partial [Phormidesmis sp.]